MQISGRLAEPKRGCNYGGQGECNFLSQFGSQILTSNIRCWNFVNLSPSFSVYWCPGDGFDALPRDHPRPDFQSIQYLSRKPPVSQRPILDNSLDNSQGPWTVGHRPGLLEHLPTQTWIAFRGWGVNWSQGCCALDLGCRVGGGSEPFY